MLGKNLSYSGYLYILALTFMSVAHSLESVKYPSLMSLRPYFFILFLIFLSSGSSILLLLFYMNPENDLKMAFLLMSTAIFLAGSSFLSFFIFFIKKVYYRGDVTTSTMNASIRQSCLLLIGTIVMFALRTFHIAELNTVLAVWGALIILELMFQALDLA